MNSETFLRKLSERYFIGCRLQFQYLYKVRYTGTLAEVDVQRKQLVLTDVDHCGSEDRLLPKSIAPLGQLARAEFAASFITEMEPLDPTEMKDESSPSDQTHQQLEFLVRVAEQSNPVGGDSTKPSWRVGDKCMARFMPDGPFCPATISELFSSSIGGDPGAIVKFDDHDGEDEWVEVKNLMREDELLSTSEEE